MKEALGPEYYTSRRLIDRMQLLGSSFRRALVLLEGDDDLQFYRRFLSEEPLVIVAGDKAQVIEAARWARCEGHEYVLGIIDRDYDSIQKPSRACSNIVLTDAHSLETLTFCDGEAVAAVVSNACVSVPGTPSEFCKQALSVTSRAASRIGYVRWAVQVLKVKVDLTRTDPFEYVEWSSGELDLPAYVGALIARQKKTNTTAGEVLGQVDNLSAQNPPWFRLARGHDLVMALVIYLTEEAVPRHPKAFGPALLSVLLRAAYSSRVLASTELYQAVADWSLETGRGVWAA